ncbi:hypothetical protein CN97_11635 [Haematobacter massiliensis]|uniref:DUF2382 domain-containing protein n=1 Tax=Haematobacter massiliensis TaxID=195105 RepID=A0A086XRZ6_9RHOB|nr:MULTISPECIES: DUF2382 domain-containing protein [Haematobacter]KFI24796.1 hypothetical protein CN97_11635 [Haematobacter massiliensis]
MTDEHTEFLPLVAETATVTADRRITGRVRVTTETSSIDSLVPLDLSALDVEVTRVSINRAIDHMPDVIVDDDLTIIPVVEERVVVTRQLYLKEEIHIRRTERRETVEVPVTTRKQTAVIERIPSDDA